MRRFGLGDDGGDYSGADYSSVDDGSGDVSSYFPSDVNTALDYNTVTASPDYTDLQSALPDYNSVQGAAASGASSSVGASAWNPSSIASAFEGVWKAINGTSSQPAQSGAAGGSYAGQGGASSSGYSQAYGTGGTSSGTSLSTQASQTGAGISAWFKNPANLPVILLGLGAVAFVLGSSSASGRR